MSFLLPNRATLVRLLLLAALAGTSLTCSDSPSEPTFEPCPGDAVTVTVSAGPTPLFTWTPACGVAFLQVFPAAGGGNLWTVWADSGSENPIPSGVRYGTTPVSSQTVAGPQPCNRGHLTVLGSVAGFVIKGCHAHYSRLVTRLLSRSSRTVLSSKRMQLADASGVRNVRIVGS